MSRNMAIEYSKKSHEKTSAVISISDFCTDSPVLENNPDNGIIARCRVLFDDVECGEANCITEDDARKITAFVLTHKKSVDRLVVHCEAGVSRSAGVAAAILKALTGTDRNVFNNPKYVPNMTCYRTVLEAMQATLH